MAAAEFRALPAEPLSEEAWDTPCPLGPDDLLSGHFRSGMRYHACLPSKMDAWFRLLDSRLFSDLSSCNHHASAIHIVTRLPSDCWDLLGLHMSLVLL